MRLILTKAVVWGMVSISALFAAGPAPVWTSLQGPDISKASIVSLDSIRGNLYAGSSDGVIYRSSPDRISWSSVFSAPFYQQRPVYSFSTCGSELVAGIGIPFTRIIVDCFGMTSPCYPPYDCGDSRRLVCSQDSGKTWSYDTLSWCWAYTVDRDTIFAFNNDTLFRRSSNIKAWSYAGILRAPAQDPPLQVPFGLCSAGRLARFGQVFVLGTFDYIARSSDNGKTWTRTSTFGVTGMVRSGDMLLAAVSPDSLFRSADTGKSWGFAGKVFAGQGINNIFASGTQCYVRADSGTMVSSDQGLTWKTMEPQPEGGWNCLLQSGQVLLEGMENGVFNMTLGTTTWTPSSQGLPRYYFNKLGVRDDTLVAAFVSPSGYDMFSRNVNGTWRPLSFFSPGDDEIVKQSQHRMIVDGASRLKITLYDMQNSNDGGATWHICGSTLPKDLCGRLSVSGLFRTDSGIVAGAGVNTMLTKDSGTTWDIVGTAWGLLAPLGSDFFAACWSVWDGTTFRDSLLITTNLGATWSPVYRTNPWNGTVKCFTSFDECLYAGTSTGAFWSTDTGKNWTSLGKDLPAKSVISFCFNKKYSFALLDSGFVYRLERPVSVYGPSFQSTGTAELKSAASITGNRITLSLGSSQHVRIEVFGIDGRQQKILLDGYVQKGTQSFPVYQGTISNSIVLLRVSGNGWSKVLKVARGMQYMR